jgi:hypothetical protein
MNHIIPIAAISQIRLDTNGRVHYRRKRAEGQEVPRGEPLPRAHAIYRQLLQDAQCATVDNAVTGPGGHCGASQESSAVDLPRTSTLRISHLPGPRRSRCAWPVDTQGTRDDALFGALVGCFVLAAGGATTPPAGIRLALIAGVGGAGGRGDRRTLPRGVRGDPRRRVAAIARPVPVTARCRCCRCCRCWQGALLVAGVTIPNSRDRKCPILFTFRSKSAGHAFTFPPYVQVLSVTLGRKVRPT